MGEWEPTCSLEGNFVDILKGKRKETENKKVEGRTAIKVKKIGTANKVREERKTRGKKEPYESQKDRQ